MLASPSAPVSAQPRADEPRPPTARVPADWSLPLVSIRSLRADPDADGVPRRFTDGRADGVPVVVAGRVAAGSGLIRADIGEIYIQDGTGGLRLILPPGAPPVLTGDSVLVHGVPSFRHGMSEVVAPSVRVLPAPSRRPVPVRLPNVPSAAGGEGPDLEGHEGEAVEVRGYVLQSDSTAAGRLLVILAGTKIVQVFAYRARAQPVRFDGVGIGDYVRVRGIAVQHDLAPPYDASYVLYPLAADDVARAGLSPRAVRTIALVVGGGLLLALLWAAALGRQVRRRSAALQTSETRYVQLLDAAADAVFVLDIARGGTLQEANRTAQMAFGVRADGRQPDGARRMLRDLAVDPADAEQHLAVASRVGAASDVVLLRRADGAEVPYEIATRVIAGQSGAPAHVSVARDVHGRQLYEFGLLEAMSEAETARREAEAARTASEAARAAAVRADALKSTIFRTMSHELRTPLTAILGFSEILVEECPADLREHAESVRLGGEQLLATLNSVLDLAQLESAGGALDDTPPGPFDAAEVVRVAAARYLRAAHEGGLALRFASAGAVPVVHVAAVVERVVGILVDNAVKFTERGEVQVSVGPVAGGVAVRVRDTGVGISEAFLPHLFEPFQQESDGHARSFEGAGLGLAIAKRLVEGVGGQIRVRSRRGEGSLFEVLLPREAPGLPSGDGALGSPAVEYEAGPGGGGPAS